MTARSTWWRRRPLRTRITVVVGLVALLVLLGVTRLGAGLLFSAAVRAGDAELRAAAAVAADRVRAGEDRLPGPMRLVDTAGSPVDGRGPSPLAPDAVASLAAGEPVTLTAGDGSPRRWVAVAVTVPDGTTRLVLASRDLTGAFALVAGSTPWLLLAALVAAAAVTVAAWVATRAALAPVDRMRLAAAALPAGQRLPEPPAADELGALVREMNALLARRDEAVTRLERFTSDAAHELRSPVAALRAQADVAVAHPDAEPAVDTWKSVAEEAQRLSALIADLLALARADAGTTGPARPVDLVDATRRAVERHTLAPVPAVALWAPIPARLAASRVEVDLVLDNLLTNARRHARSVVSVSVVPAGRWVRLLVDDDGPGVPTADRERVFDRFTRLAPGPGQEAGDGAGLGLAIVARLVDGHGGTVRVGASPYGGARVTVRWPTAP